MKHVERKSLVFFIIVAYTISWLCWIMAFLLNYQDIPFMSLIGWQFESTKQIAGFFIFRLGVYGPLIASIVVTYYYFKTQGLRGLIGRITKWRVSAKWYFYVFMVPVIINLIVVLVGLLIGVPISNFFNSNIPLNFIFIYLLFQIFTSGLEEPGWRGFALEILQKNYTAEKASWILGLIWAVWHYPYVISLYYHGGLFATVLSLAGFTMAIIGQTFIITWLYNNTRSVFVAIIFHAWINTSTIYILGDITITNPIIGIIPALVTWGIVFVLLKVYGGQSLVKEQA